MTAHTFAPTLVSTIRLNSVPPAPRKDSTEAVRARGAVRIYQCRDDEQDCRNTYSSSQHGQRDNPRSLGRAKSCRSLPVGRSGFWGVVVPRPGEGEGASVRLNDG